MLGGPTNDGQQTKPPELGRDPDRLAQRAWRADLTTGAFAGGWVALLTLAAALAGPRVAAGVGFLAGFTAMLVVVVAAARGR